MSSPFAPKGEWKGILTSVKQNKFAKKKLDRKQEVNSSDFHKPRTSKGFILV